MRLVSLAVSPEQKKKRKHKIKFSDASHAFQFTIVGVILSAVRNENTNVTALHLGTHN